MPDFGSPATANFQPPDFTKTLSGLMGLQQQKQALQSGALGIQQQQQQLQVGENAAQGAQQTMQERQRVTQMMQSGVDDQGNSIRGSSGDVDPAKALLALGRIAPMTGQQYAQNLMQTMNAKVSVQSAATALDGQQRAALMGPIQAIATNPSDPEMLTNANAALEQWGSAHPEMGGLVTSAKRLLSHVAETQDPQQRAKLANSMAALFQPGQTVQTQPQGATVNNGQKTLAGTTAPPVAGGDFTPGNGVQQQIPPTAQVTDPTTGGQRLYGPQGQPGPATSVTPMQGANIQTAMDIRKSANDGAATYPQGQFNNNQIVRLAQDPNALGHGGDLLSKWGGGWATVPWSASDMTTNWNNIGHFMGLQAITQMKAAGLAGTDADKALAQSVTGDRTYDKDSVVNIARTNRALGEGSRLYNEGVERAYARGDPSAVTQFRNQWSSTANVDGFLLYNAKRSAKDDPGALPAVVKDMGGANSPRYKAALSSIDQMRSLILGGGNGAR